MLGVPRHRAANKHQVSLSRRRREDPEQRCDAGCDCQVFERWQVINFNTFCKIDYQTLEALFLATASYLKMDQVHSTLGLATMPWQQRQDLLEVLKTTKKYLDKSFVTYDKGDTDEAISVEETSSSRESASSSESGSSNASRGDNDGRVTD